IISKLVRLKTFRYPLVCARINNSNGCCRCITPGGGKCSRCYPYGLMSYLVHMGTPVSHADEIMREMLEDVSGNRYFVSTTTAESRRERLNRNIRELYHQTKPEFAHTILISQKMKRGDPSCLAGSGIYFAINAQDTYHKAHYNGVILKCSVKLDNV